MSKKVMVCDDDKSILEMMEMIMQEFGYEVFTESNSLNVLNDIEVEKPDLLLLDIWMPARSGDQVLKLIKAEPKLSNLPVIMYSASAEGVAIAKSCGADDYIAKPFDLDMLETKINALI